MALQDLQKETHTDRVGVIPLTPFWIPSKIFVGVELLVFPCLEGSGTRGMVVPSPKGRPSCRPRLWEPQTQHNPLQSSRDRWEDGHHLTRSE